MEVVDSDNAFFEGNSPVHSYKILFAHFWFSYTGGKFKHAGVMLQQELFRSLKPVYILNSRETPVRHQLGVDDFTAALWVELFSWEINENMR